MEEYIIKAATRTSIVVGNVKSRIHIGNGYYHALHFTWNIFSVGAIKKLFTTLSRSSWTASTLLHIMERNSKETLNTILEVPWQILIYKINLNKQKSVVFYFQPFDNIQNAFKWDKKDTWRQIDVWSNPKFSKRSNEKDLVHTLRNFQIETIETNCSNAPRERAPGRNMTRNIESVHYNNRRRTLQIVPDLLSNKKVINNAPKNNGIARRWIHSIHTIVEHKDLQKRIQNSEAEDVQGRRKSFNLNEKSFQS